MQQDLRPSRSPVVFLRTQESEAAFTRDKTAEVENRCSAFVKGSRPQSLPSLGITSVEIDKTRSVEAPNVKKSAKNPPPEILTLNEVPTTALRVRTDETSEPKPVCTQH